MPTNDELRAAAERVRLCRSRSMLTVYGVESLPDATALYFDDAYAIAEARLSQPAPATDEQIAELKRLCEAATPGPWASDGAASPYVRGNPFSARGASVSPDVIEGGMQDEQGGAVGVLSNDDAAFIAASRNALPALIARLERAEAEIERLRKDAARYRFIRQKRVGVLDCTWPLWNSTETLDAAIDAAMQETNDA